MKRLLPFVIALLLLSACSSPPPQPAHDYPMGPLSFTVRGSTLHGSIPAGWFSPPGDTLTPALDAWLVNEDYSSSISVRELSVDATTRRRIAREGMSLLATLSMSFRGDSTAAPPAAFMMNEHQYGSYEISAAGIHSRIIVFTRGGKYYECEAKQHRAGLADAEMERLRRAQLAILSSLAE